MLYQLEDFSVCILSKFACNKFKDCGCANLPLYTFTFSDTHGAGAQKWQFERSELTLEENLGEGAFGQVWRGKLLLVSPMQTILDFPRNFH